MKKRLFVPILIFISVSSSQAFDVKGLQPLSPFGVFSSFSAESLRSNHYGFGTTIERSSNPDFLRTALQTSFGLRDNIELNLGLPYVSGWQNGIDGFEDPALGFKHRIYDGGYYTPSIAYMLTASLNNGRSYFSAGGSLGGGVLITERIGPFKGHLNAFYSNAGKAGLKDEYSLLGGLELAVTHNSVILAEIEGKKNYFKNKIDLLDWRLGYRVATTENIYTTIGAGFDIKKMLPDYRLMFSVSILLPWEKMEVDKKYYEE